MTRSNRSKRNAKPKSQPKPQISKTLPTTGSPGESPDENEPIGQKSSDTSQSTPDESDVYEAPKDKDGKINEKELDKEKLLAAFKRRSVSLFKRLGIPFIRGLASFIGVIKIEALIGAMTVILTLGQYFYSGINTRMTITALWREGYTAETRSRVAKFIYFFEVWKKKHEQGQGFNPYHTIYNLASPEELFKPNFIQGDPNIKELVYDEIELIRIRDKDKLNNKQRVITNEDYISAALNYRNAIIECLNTAEAVKAVIEAKPWPFRPQIIYAETLEGRYKDIILELKTNLMPFITSYRELHPDRETQAWFVLTSEESNRNDYLVIKVSSAMLALVLLIIYLIKMLYRKYIGD